MSAKKNFFREVATAGGTLAYEKLDSHGNIAVYLAKRRVGTIKAVAAGHQFVAKGVGKAEHRRGQVFATLGEVFRSLEN